MRKLFDCKVCIQRLVNIVEGVPLSLQTKINGVMGKLSEIANSDHIPVMNKDELNLKMQMERMTQYVEVLKMRVDNWKHLIEYQFDEKSSGLSNAWHSFTSDPENQILVHYTARCKLTDIISFYLFNIEINSFFIGPLIVNYVCAVCCFGFSALYHLFSSHSKRIMTKFIKFDYAGISLMIAGSSTPPIYYAFSCSDLR